MTRYYASMKHPETWQQFIRRKDEQFQSELEKKKSVNMKDIGRNGSHQFLRVAWTFMPQHNLPQKVFVVERMERSGKKGKIAYTKLRHAKAEYRIGYYIVGRIGHMRNRWTWGQFCPIIPLEDFQKLLRKAKKEQTIL